MSTESRPLSTSHSINDYLSIPREDFHDWLIKRTTDELLDAWLVVDERSGNVAKSMKPFIDKEVTPVKEGSLRDSYSKKFLDRMTGLGGLLNRKFLIWEELNKRMHTDDGYFGKMRLSLRSLSLPQLRDRYDQLDERINILEKQIHEIETCGADTSDKEGSRNLAQGELQEVVEVMATQYGFKSNKVEAWEHPTDNRMIPEESE